MRRYKGSLLPVSRSKLFRSSCRAFGLLRYVKRHRCAWLAQLLPWSAGRKCLTAGKGWAFLYQHRLLHTAILLRKGKIALFRKIELTSVGAI